MNSLPVSSNIVYPNILPNALSEAEKSLKIKPHLLCNQDFCRQTLILTRSITRASDSSPDLKIRASDLHARALHHLSVLYDSELTPEESKEKKEWIAPWVQRKKPLLDGNELIVFDEYLQNADFKRIIGIINLNPKIEYLVIPGQPPIHKDLLYALFKKDPKMPISDLRATYPLTNTEGETVKVSPAIFHFYSKWGNRKKIFPIAKKI